MSGVTSGDNRPRCVRGRQSYAQVPSTRSVVIHCINSRVALYDNRNAYPFACFTILKIRPDGANKCDLTQIPANRENNREFFILDKVATRSGVRVRRHSNDETRASIFDLRFDRDDRARSSRTAISRHANNPALASRVESDRSTRPDGGDSSFARRNRYESSEFAGVVEELGCSINLIAELPFREFAEFANKLLAPRGKGRKVDASGKNGLGMRNKSRGFRTTVRLDRSDNVSIPANEIRNKGMPIRSTFNQNGDGPISPAKVTHFVTQANKIDPFAKLVEEEVTITG